jgi:hypothetical protein
MADDVVGSKLPANNGYGQNGFPGPSSDEPGKNTTSGFLPGITDADLSSALDRVNPKDRDTVRDRSGKGNPASPKDFKQPKFAAPQTRTVSDESYPLSFGMDQRTSRKS